jgi:MoaD family protein
MTVTVKFVGALRHITDKPKIELKVTANFSVKDLIQRIFENIPELKAEILTQQAVVTIKNSTIILVNEREISVLNGLDTLLVDGDEVVFIPVAHGG